MLSPRVEKSKYLKRTSEVILETYRGQQHHEDRRKPFSRTRIATPNAFKQLGDKMGDALGHDVWINPLPPHSSFSWSPPLHTLGKKLDPRTGKTIQNPLSKSINLQRPANVRRYRSPSTFTTLATAAAVAAAALAVTDRPTDWQLAAAVRGNRASRCVRRRAAITQARSAFSVATSKDEQQLQRAGGRVRIIQLGKRAHSPRRNNFV